MAFYEPNRGQPRAPPCPPPWFAEWDQRDQRWLYINTQTNERTFEHPHPNYQQGGYGGNYPPQQGGNYPPQQGGYGGGGYGQQSGNFGEGYQQQPPPHKKDHKAMEYGALGAVGGVVAGAFAMHEGEKIHRDYEYDKDRVEGDIEYDKDRVENRYDYDRDRIEDRVDYDRDRVENRVDYDVDRVEDFPGDASRWAGREEERVEDFPEDASRWAGREEQKVEDIPDDIAGWAGRKVGDVERFDDNVQDNFDYGRDEQRYDDDRY